MPHEPHARAAWEPAVASGHEQGSDCPFLTLKMGLSMMPKQRCPPVVVPTTPSYITTAALMKNPATTTTTKTPKRVWFLLQGDD